MGPASGIFNISSDVAKAKNLWPKGHPSASKELKKPNWHLLTSLLHIWFRSHRVESPR
jgi:hypothetical protein